MRRDDPPHYYAINHRQGAVVVCETARHGKRVAGRPTTINTTEYIGIDGFVGRTADGVVPFDSFADANGAVKHLRDESVDTIRRR